MPKPAPPAARSDPTFRARRRAWPAADGKLVSYPALATLTRADMLADLLAQIYIQPHVDDQEPEPQTADAI